MFAVAVMVSAWYGGWKPGLAATSFALTVSAYYSFTGEQTPSEYRKAIAHLALFFAVALLICWFNAALRATQESLRRSESNFRSLVMNAPYGICRCNALGILQDANPALVAMFGYDKRRRTHGPASGKPLRRCPAMVSHRRLFSRPQGIQQRDHGVRAQGWRSHRRAHLRTLHSQRQRTVTASRFLWKTLPKPALLELQLRHAQKMEAIGRLAGGIAHDFNNLLMVISGYSEFLLERLGPDPRLRGPAQEISNATQRATSLTRQLLAFSRKQMLAPKLLDLNEVVAENLKMLTRMIGEDIDLVMVPGPALGAVRADPGQIDQVIMNLAVNARDAMPQGGKLTIETANVTLDENFARTHTPLTPGDYIMLAISDTGIGMDNETQARIFEPFFTTKGSKGTGLGLSTVYGIVKQSGALSSSTAKPQRGTAFRAYFPRVDGREDAAAAQDSARPSPRRSWAGDDPPRRR
jgi:two-component system, cell cycle sensor histidine kinase and response regulator CckA